MFTQLPVFNGQPLSLQRLADGLEQRRPIQRFLDEIISTQAHRLDGFVHRGVGGKHDDFDRRADFLGALDYLDAVQVGQH